MEIERRLNSIQWNILRSFLIATLSSALAFFILLITFWQIVSTWEPAKAWYVSWSGRSLPMLTELVNDLFILLIVLGLSTVVSGVVIGFYMGRKIKRNLQSLSWAFESLTQGNLNYRVEVEGNDEVAELAEQFNLMATRIESQVATLQRLVQKNAELHQQAKQLAANEERQRLARDLHDSISQQLFAISMSTAAANRLLDRDIEKARRQFQYIEQMSGSVQAEMRALLLHLRPVQLSGRNLSEAIEELLQELQQKQNLNYEWEIDHFSDLPLGVEEHLFRIVQEGVSNALRHSQAKKISVTLKKREQLIVLRIIDNGIGFKNEQGLIGTSMGLDNINERVNEMGGIIDIISSEGKGTILEVRIPLLVKGES